MGKGKKRTSTSTSADVYQLSPTECRKLDKLAYKRPMFKRIPGNSDLDVNNKMAALKVSPSIVSLVSFSGEVLVSQNCGTIIEVEENVNTVMTSLNLIRQPTKAKKLENTLAKDLKIIVHTSNGKSYIGHIETCDFHYNLLIIKFKSTTTLQSANLRMVDDDPGLDRSFQTRPHGSKAKHGDPVLVVGRYFYDSFNTMAAPGCLRMNRRKPEYDCRELLLTSCKITRCGDGGPVINLSGEVIGFACYYLGATTPFLPINVAFKWWNHFKTQKELRHPSYGFEASNLYLADLHTLERVLERFPSTSNGILVEKVQPGSHAEYAGLHEGDIVIKCDGKTVQSFCELWDLIWEKVGHVVELEVLRVDHSNSLSISMSVGEATPNEVNSWPAL